jgi:uncharacterized protein YbjT (DUF2867 family)
MDFSRTGAPVLVTGATGRHGGTGSQVVRRLREAGMSVRVLVHRRDERVVPLEELGAEVVVGDMHDRASLLPALDGVDLVFFAYPINGGIVTAAANYAAAVRAVGRSPRTVVMSMGPAHPDHLSDLGRAQWLAEEVFGWAGLDLLILRIAAAFQQNIPMLHGSSIRTEGVIRNCFGTARVAWLNAKDAAEVGVAGLLHPERFAGSVVHYPPGSEELTHEDIANILADALDRPIRFEVVSRSAWREELITLAEANPGGPVNPEMAGHISAVGESIANRAPTRPADAGYLAGLIGRAPIGMKAFLLDERSQFES